jgi:hypothetical protein
MSANVARQAETAQPRTSNVTTTPVQSGATALSYEKFRQHYDMDLREKWHTSVVEKLVELSNLPPDWDSYGASPVKWDAGMFALNILTKVMLPRTPAPQIVPSPVGGAQLEWHVSDIDLEFHVAGPYDCELWFADHRTGKTVSSSVSDDLSELQEAVRTLSKR